MMKKYEICDKVYDPLRKLELCRIKAVRDFGGVRSGDIGGWIQSGENLSHDGNCWVYGEARVYDNAKVYDSANVYDCCEIYGDAKVYGDAEIFDKARVLDRAKVFGDSILEDSVSVRGTSWIYGHGRISDWAVVRGSSIVCGHGWVCENATVFGNSQIGDWGVVKGTIVLDSCRIRDRAIVGSDPYLQNYSSIKDCVIEDHGRVMNSAVIVGCTISEHGVVSERQHVSSCPNPITVDLSKDLIASILLQTGLSPLNGVLTCWKRVRSDLTSVYDKTFVYKVGEWASVKYYDGCAQSSCSSGLHVSHANHWPGGDRIIQCKVNVEDIIAVQEGKIRCKRLFVEGICD